MTILNKIYEYKKQEVTAAKRLRSTESLQNEEFYERLCLSFGDFVRHPSKTGIIAEFKRASPSKGLINGHSSVADVVAAYEQAGASAVSVLTDGPSFQGKIEDLVAARNALQIPLLRKEFIIDAYQIMEAKAFGADVILLIAAMLSPSEIREFSAFAKTLGLSVLLEVHDLAELEVNLVPEIDAIGVNNRNLHDFSVSIDHSLDLVNRIPSEYAKISESGISDPKTLALLKEAGFDGFLIGENFMKTEDPGIEMQRFLHGVPNFNQKDH